MDLGLSHFMTEQTKMVVKSNNHRTHITLLQE